MLVSPARLARGEPVLTYVFPSEKHGTLELYRCQKCAGEPVPELPELPAVNRTITPSLIGRTWATLPADYKLAQGGKDDQHGYGIGGVDGDTLGTDQTGRETDPHGETYAITDVTRLRVAGLPQPRCEKLVAGSEPARCLQLSTGPASGKDTPMSDIENDVANDGGR